MGSCDMSVCVTMKCHADSVTDSNGDPRGTRLGDPSSEQRPVEAMNMPLFVG